MKGDGDALANGGFLRPASPEAACELLARWGDGAKILAGGTDLMVAVNRKEQPLEVVIHIGRIGLDYIRAAENRLIVGAATAHADIVCTIHDAVGVWIDEIPLTPEGLLRAVEGK